MKENGVHRFLPFLIELAVYAVLVFAYVVLVLRYLSGWIKELYDQGKGRYALAAIALIIGQAVVLEFVTGALLRFIRSKIKGRED